MKKTFVWVGIIIILAIGMFFGLSRFSTKTISVPLSGQVATEEGRVVEVRIANTPEARQQGLSGVAHLGPQEGMLFLFKTSGKHAFWMKEMLFSLDILWLKKIPNSSDMFEIVSIARNVSPDTYPKIFYPDQNADAVLEINKGMADVYNLTLQKKVWISF